jgi:hypothetical protein
MKFIPIIGTAVLSATLFSSIHEARADEVYVAGRETSVTESGPNRAMLHSGVIAFGVPYVASVIVAATSNHPGDHNLYVPVAGPWIDLSERHCPQGDRCSDGLNKGLLVVNGVFQAIGALDIVGAFLFPQTITSRAASREQTSPATAKVYVAPSGVGTGYGLSAVGLF